MCLGTCSEKETESPVELGWSEERLEPGIPVGGPSRSFVKSSDSSTGTVVCGKGNRFNTILQDSARRWPTGAEGRSRKDSSNFWFGWWIT